MPVRKKEVSGVDQLPAAPSDFFQVLLAEMVDVSREKDMYGRLLLITVNRQNSIV